MEALIGSMGAVSAPPQCPATGPRGSPGGKAEFSTGGGGGAGAPSPAARRPTGGSAPSWGRGGGARGGGWGTPTPRSHCCGLGPTPPQESSNATTSSQMSPSRGRGGRIGVRAAPSPPGAEQTPLLGGGRREARVFCTISPVTANSNFPKVTGWLCQRGGTPPASRWGARLQPPPGRVKGGPGGHEGTGRGCPARAPHLSHGQGRGGGIWG